VVNVKKLTESCGIAATKDQNVRSDSGLRRMKGTTVNSKMGIQK
jgi:hypothetical protein